MKVYFEWELRDESSLEGSAYTPFQCYQPSVAFGIHEHSSTNQCSCHPVELKVHFPRKKENDVVTKQGSSRKVHKSGHGQRGHSQKEFIQFDLWCVPI